MKHAISLSEKIKAKNVTTKMSVEQYITSWQAVYFCFKSRLNIYSNKIYSSRFNEIDILI